MCFADDERPLFQMHIARYLFILFSFGNA